MSEVDGRTNAYALTAAGVAALRQLRERAERALAAVDDTKLTDE